MNDQPEKKIDTKPLPDLQAIQPGQSRIAQPTQPTETTEEPPPIPQGDDMPTEWTLETLAAEVQRRGEISDERMKWVTSELRRHDAEIGEINTWRGSILTHDQLSDLIDEKWQARWQAIDQEYNRLDKLRNDMTVQFSENITAQNNILVQMRVMQDSADTRDKLLKAVASSQSIMLGYNIEDPNAKPVGESYVDIIREVRRDAKEAREKAQRAETDVAEARTDIGAVASQFKGWLNEANTLKAQLARLEENDRKQDADRQRWQELRELAYKAVTSKLFIGIAAGVISGMGSLAIFKDQIIELVQMIFK